MFKLITGLLKKSARSGTIKSLREAKNMMGFPEIEGIKNISDNRIMEIYDEVESVLSEVGTIRKELKLLRYQMVDCIVRDRLIGEINGRYKQELESMRRQCVAHGYRAAYIKGKSYTGL
jgi:hypothetical protein